MFGKQTPVANLIGPQYCTIEPQRTGFVKKTPCHFAAPA
ncbi:hypothetical protein BV133_2611 [Blastochloris viridis]|uniref:Uncharacterized protein n=1 Tax=Blastochloris viridis TaxID=1079 RepID=A0A182D462_BLAVI|nr:hypothetical protein BV133_2611 [Blastochloris viridis]